MEVRHGRTTEPNININNKEQQKTTTGLKKNLKKPQWAKENKEGQVNKAILQLPELN